MWNEQRKPKAASNCQHLRHLLLRDSQVIASYLMPFTKNENKIKNTTEFSERRNSCSLNDQEIAVSYDVSSLFTEVPLDETINDIVEEIYTRNKLCKLDPKHLFKWLLCNVTKNTVYPLSPVFANIFMAKLEEDKVLPYNLPFYDHNVDDCFSNKVENEPDRLFERLNNYRHNIKFTVEEKPSHFLDTAFTYQDQTFHRRVYRKPGKVPTHWSSQVPTNWKRNSIMGALHRAKRILTDLESDIKEITKIYLKAGYPKRFIQATINRFHDQTDEEERPNPEYMFEERRKVFIKLPYSQDNEKLSKRFTNRLNTFTNGRFMFIILWQTRKIKSLFNLKDKNRHKSNVIYRAECSCGETYIGETKQKKHSSTKGRTREEVSQLQTSPSPRKISNTHIHIKHCVHRENHLSDENNRGPVNCLWETNPKQTSTMFRCKTVLLVNNIIHQNQVVCKSQTLPLNGPDDDHTVENVLVF